MSKHTGQSPPAGNDTRARLPDFLIVGAPRSGTSSLNHYLRQHPDVFMSARKEPRFFTENLSRGLDWYAPLFTGARPDQQVGEASPDYLWRRAGVTIHDHLPEVKAIALLREPVSRAWSHYWMRRSRGLEVRPFGAIVEAELAGDVDLYVTPGRYAEQLEDLATFIPAASIHVESFESLRDQPAETFARICRFVGVDDAFAPTDLGRAVNAQQGFRSVWVRNRSRHLPPIIRSALGKLNAKAFTPPTIDAVSESLLRAYYAPLNAQLTSLWLDVGSAWETPEANTV